MSKRSPLLYVHDIRESIDAIFQYVQSLTFEEFSGDRMRYSAVIREFEIIGEAAGKLPAILKERFPKIEWQDIKDFRNLLIHEYFGVNPKFSRFGIFVGWNEGLVNIMKKTSSCAVKSRILVPTDVMVGE